MRSSLKWLAVIGTCLIGSSASAATCSGDGSPWTKLWDEIGLTVTSTTGASVACYAVGKDNIGSINPQDVIVGGNNNGKYFEFIGAQLTDLVMIDDTRAGDSDFLSGNLSTNWWRSLTGNVTVSDAVASQYDKILLGLNFKSFGPLTNIDWAVFDISEAGDFVWTQSDRRPLQGMVLYGKAAPQLTVAAQVLPTPLPAGMVLLLSGVAAFGVMRRRSRGRNAA